MKFNGSFDGRATDSEEFFKSNSDKALTKDDLSKVIVGADKNVPVWRTVDFYVGVSVGSDGKTLSAKRQNWRNINCTEWGGLDFSTNPVEDQVLLIPNTRKLEFSGGWELESYSENLGKAGSLLDILNMAQEVKANTRIAKVWNPYLFKDLKNLTMGGDFEFKFNFGSAGIYDAFEEVVKPIYALLNFFAAGSSDTGIKAEVSNLPPPFPTKSMFIRDKLKGAYSTVKSAAADGQSFSSLADLNSKLQSAIQAGAKDVALSQNYNNLWVSWGRFTYGPMVYDSLKYSFDMDSFDSNGWPISGTFTLGGVKSMRMATTNTLNSTIIQGL